MNITDLYNFNYTPTTLGGGTNLTKNYMWGVREQK
jgi:hypothetical protein